jgi:hypothetical protein
MDGAATTAKMRTAETGPMSASMGRPSYADSDDSSLIGRLVRALINRVNCRRHFANLSYY